MLEIKNVSLRNKNRDLLKNINIKFETGNIYGIIGQNGAGSVTRFLINV